MCIFINDVALFNSSAVALCSRRLGFPFVRPEEASTRGDGRIEVTLAAGLERIIKPIERSGLLQTQPFVYQPMFLKDAEGVFPAAYNTDYVRRNCYDSNAGLGALFLQRRGEVTKLETEASSGWIPDSEFSLREAYRNGIRWAYRKLEENYSAQASGDWSRLPYSTMHNRILRLMKTEMGL